jgi:hypothetical protein
LVTTKTACNLLPAGLRPVKKLTSLPAYGRDIQWMPAYATAGKKPILVLLVRIPISAVSTFEHSTYLLRLWTPNIFIYKKLRKIDISGAYMVLLLQKTHSIYRDSITPQYAQ